MENDLTEDEQRACEVALRDTGCDVAAATYLKEMRAVQMLGKATPMQAAAGSAAGLFSMAAGKMKEGASWWKSGIKSLMPTSGDLPTTRIVGTLMDLKASELTRDYLYFVRRAASVATINIGKATGTQITTTTTLTAAKNAPQPRICCTSTAKPLQLQPTITSTIPAATIIAAITIRLTNSRHNCCHNRNRDDQSNCHLKLNHGFLATRRRL